MHTSVVQSEKCRRLRASIGDGDGVITGFFGPCAAHVLTAITFSPATSTSYLIVQNLQPVLSATRPSIGLYPVSQSRQQMSSLRIVWSSDVRRKSASDGSSAKDRRHDVSSSTESASSLCAEDQYSIPGIPPNVTPCSCPGDAVVRNRKRTLVPRLFCLCRQRLLITAMATQRHCSAACCVLHLRRSDPSALCTSKSALW